MSSRGVNLSPDCDVDVLMVNSPNFLRVDSFVDEDRTTGKCACLLASRNHIKTAPMFPIFCQQKLNVLVYEKVYYSFLFHKI